MSSVVWAGTAPGAGAAWPALVVATALLGVAAWHDARSERIPNRLLTAAGVIGAIAAAAAGVSAIGHAVLGAVLAGVPMLVVLLARGIGMGDVKMAAVAGAVGGLVHPLVGPVAVLVMAVGVATLGAVTGRQRWPLGPFIWIAFVGSALTIAPLAGGRP